jgi:hypothetical protein
MRGLDPSSSRKIKKKQLWALVNTITGHQIISKLGSYLNRYATISFSRRTVPYSSLLLNAPKTDTYLDSTGLYCNLKISDRFDNYIGYLLQKLST